MEFSPKKRFGQHFLRDSGVLDRIVRLVQPRASDLFLEVGAGTGALTVRIAQHGARVYAVELDLDIVPLLHEAAAPHSSVTVVAEDILRMDLPSLLLDEMPGRTLRAIGNLPYNIATAVIETCLNSALRFEDLTFMTQLEVAERIVASPGTKAYGYLSVFCQHLADVRLAFKVSPGSFLPPPKVTSAVVVFRPRRTQSGTRRDQCVVEVAKAAFAHRRKMLANSLRQSPAVAPLAATLLQRAHIDGSRRAEQLTVCEYEELARVYSELF